MTPLTTHFQSQPRSKVRIGLISSTTGGAVLPHAVMMSTVLVAVCLLAVATKIASIQEGWNTRHAMIVVLCFSRAITFGARSYCLSLNKIVPFNPSNTISWYSKPRYSWNCFNSSRPQTPCAAPSSRCNLLAKKPWRPRPYTILRYCGSLSTLCLRVTIAPAQQSSSLFLI